jgi:hypothetical protein
MYGFIKKLITIEPLTPEEEAKRAADSIASLDEEKYYDDERANIRISQRSAKEDENELIIAKRNLSSLLAEFSFT